MNRSHPRNTLWSGLVISGLLALCGCYKYEYSNTPPQLGSHVELLLTEDAQADFRERGVSFVEYFTTGAGALDGIILENTNDSLLVRIASVRLESYQSQTLYQHVALAHADLQQIRQRRLNDAATIALVGIAGGVLTYLVLEAIKAGSPECPAPSLSDCR